MSVILFVVAFHKNHWTYLDDSLTETFFGIRNNMFDCNRQTRKKLIIWNLIQFVLDKHNVVYLKNWHINSSKHLTNDNIVCKCKNKSVLVNFSDSLINTGVNRMRNRV